MELLYIIIAAYVVAVVINILIIRNDVIGLRGWIAMLGDSRHGLLLNIVAYIVIFIPPFLYLILLINLYGFILKKVRAR